MTEPVATPLSEASVSSLDEFFSRKPPFDEEALTAIVKELRRMREKWESLGEGTPVTAKKRAAKSAGATVQLSADDLWSE